MEEVIKHLEENRIEYLKISDSIIEISGTEYHLITPEFGLLIDKNNKFVRLKERDDVIFDFGGELYYCKYDKFELNELRYIGLNTYLIDDNTFLGVHGPMEILRGSRVYSDWIKKAKFLGIKNLGICELDTLAGAMKFQIECNNNGIKPIIGMQVSVVDEDDSVHLVNLYVMEDIGWDSILSINKIINVNNVGEPITNKLLGLNMVGLRAIYNVNTITYKQFNKYARQSAYFSLSRLEYKDNLEELNYLQELSKFIRDSNLVPIALTNSYYLEEDHNRVKKELKQISKVAGKVRELGEFFHTNEDLYFHYENRTKNIKDLFEIAVSNANILANECNFKINQSGRNLPRYKMNQNEIYEFGIDGSEDLFWSIVEKGLSRLNLPEDKLPIYLKRIETEWEVVEYGDVMDYFLILWDVINWSRKNNILVGTGRGSAAGSLISYCMDITRIDPIEYKLLFERFLNRGRVEKSLPDIDVDFSGKRRGEVKDYIMSKYGSDYFCSVGTYTNLKPKSLIKEIGKLNGLEHKDINYVTTLMDESSDFMDIFVEANKRPQVKKFVQNNVGIINETRLMNLQPKAESIHACATIVVPDTKEIYEWIPVKIMNQGGHHVLVSQWEGGELEAAGFLKEDILGLGLLDKYEMMLDLIKKECGEEIDLYSINHHDPMIYEYCRNGWNSDIFQFGTPGLTSYCIEMKPDNIEDMIAAVSLYRPGPMENGFHKKYIKCKSGEDEVYHFPYMEDITKDTYGILCYQEQIMQTCVTVGGLPLSEADDIRKSMVKKKLSEIEKYSEKFHEHAINVLNIDEEVVEEIWDTLLKFASYGFNRSHAAAYTIMSLYGQWFKIYYPLQFWSATFSFGNEKTYPRFLSEIYKIGGIKVIAVDINLSGEAVNSDLSTNALYWSLNSVKQCGDKAFTQLVEDRNENGEYLNFDNFLTRHVRKGSKVNKAVIENLIICGAFDSLEFVGDDLTDRWRLVQYYHEYAKVRGDHSSKFTNPDSKIWWSLMQRELCGLSMIDYSNISSTISRSNDWDTPDLFQSYGDGYSVKVIGYVQELEVKKIRGGKRMAIIKLDHNYDNFSITIWDETLNQYENEIVNSVGKILSFKGNIKYDNYWGEYKVFSNKNSVVEINI
tara:strand:+ start:53336 stop:56707 length:3372 start_codon:yes stop_codon:yes gene_type:complete